MTMTNIFDIADDVADKLNSGQGRTWNAVVVQAIRNEATELDNLTVSVVPYSVREKEATRSAVYRTVSVAVAVQKRISPSNWSTDVKSLLDTVEELKDELRDVTLECGYRYVSDTQDPVYQQEHLLEQSVFTSVVEFEFIAAEAVIAS